MKKRRVCIAGSSGHGLSILESLEALHRIEVAGYCATYEEESMAALTEAFDRLGQKLCRYADYRQMLEEAKPEIVVIDSMFCDHAPLALEALKRKMHVYCEKPLATEQETFALLVSEARQSKAKIFAMQSLRYLPWFYTAKQLTDEGYIGKVRMINVQKSYKLGERPDFFNHRKTYGGTIPWVGIHGIDLILWISGKKAVAVSAFQSSADNFGHGELEMTAVCNFQLEDSVVANLQTDYYRTVTAPSHSDDRLRIVGTKGVVEVRADKVYLTNQAYYEQEWEVRKTPYMFADFLAYIQGSADSLIDTEGSLYTTEIALLTREAAETGTIKVCSKE